MDVVHPSHGFLSPYGCKYIEKWRGEEGEKNDL